jgi:hypothetical protein
MPVETIIGLSIFGPFLFAAGVACFFADYFNMRGK